MTQLPHELKRIRLNLARSKEFPLGSARHGYEFVAPLDGAGHIDPHLWHKHREHCRVRRFWGQNEELGRLVHKPGGKEKPLWVQRMVAYRRKTLVTCRTCHEALHRERPGQRHVPT